MIANRLFPLHYNRIAVGGFRLSAQLAHWHIPVLPHLLYVLNAIIWGCELHYRASIGLSFRLAQSQGIVVGSD